MYWQWITWPTRNRIATPRKESLGKIRPLQRGINWQRRAAESEAEAFQLGCQPDYLIWLQLLGLNRSKGTKVASDTNEDDEMHSWKKAEDRQDNRRYWNMGFVGPKINARGQGKDENERHPVLDTGRLFEKSEVESQITRSRPVQVGKASALLDADRLQKSRPPRPKMGQRRWGVVVLLLALSFWRTSYLAWQCI